MTHTAAYIPSGTVVIETRRSDRLASPQGELNRMWITPV
jgi:hypothetical protein